MAQPSESTDRLPPGQAETALSFAQEAKSSRVGLVHSQSLAYRIVGSLDHVELRSAVSGVLRRHEELRRVFRVGDEGWLAVTVAQAPDLVEYADLSGLPRAEAFHQSRRLISEAFGASFDLTSAPGFRASIIKLHATETFVALTAHPAVADIFSLHLVMNEIGVLYAAHGGECGRAEAGRYADYARGQRADYQAGRFEPQRSALARALRDLPEILELPTDRPRSSLLAVTTARTARPAPSHILRQLAELAEDSGKHLQAVLVSAFAVLMHRYTGQANLAIGTLSQNRDEPAYARTVGSFAQTLPVFFSFDEKTTFRDVLNRFRGSPLTGPDGREAPYPRILEDLGAIAHSQSHPVFQVAVNLATPPEPPEFGAGLATELWSAHQDVTGLDLSIHVIMSGDQAEFRADYDPGLFEAATVDRLLDHYSYLLSQLGPNVDTEVRRIRIIPEHEERLILQEWNATAADYPDGSVVDFIEAQAARTPTAIAVEYEDQFLTYEELNRRANRIAHVLGEKDPRSDFVGIYMDRSIDMVVALLAVVKAGLAYVPLAPEYPVERCRQMVEDSGIRTILTQPHYRAPVSAWGARCYLLDHLESRAGDDANPVRKLSPDSPVYMIYTSGSTGMPKGVINRHGSLFNRLYWMQATYQLRQEDRVLQKTPFGFDVSVWEFFWPLMFGARIVVARPGGHTDPAYVRQIISRRQVTVAHFVPSMLNVFLDQRNLRDYCRSLRWVICSGEALSGDTIEKFYESIPSGYAKLQNLYGPTEAAIDVSYWPCPPDYCGTVVPIGRPIANVQLYVLDKHLQLQPVGAPGELCIGGIALAEGYHRRRDLSEQAFVTLSPGHKLGPRLYRTGDQARYRADGEIEYLGRMDRQVKVRGFRVELGEIEARLRGLPPVRDAAVVLRETAHDQALVAYLVGGPFDPAALREQLRLYLPDAMIPQLFVPIPAIPVTANGKLDRAALPDPAAMPHPEPHRPKALEAQLLALWRSLLPVADIGVTDNFLDLGGHSLLAAQLAIRANRELGLRLTARDIFAYPTIAALANALSRDGAEGSGQFPEIVQCPEEAGDSFPLTTLQEAYWVGESDLYQLGGARAHMHMELHWPQLDVAAAERALDAMAARHDVLRMIVAPDGRQRVLRQVPGFRARQVDLRSSPGQAEALQGFRDDFAVNGPSTDEWPLFDVVACQLTDDDYRVFLRISLLLTDAHSESLMAGEFFEFYRGRVPAALPPAPSYRDHVLAMRALESRSSGPYEAAGKYWLERMPLPPAPDLPRAVPLTMRSARFTRRRFQLDRASWATLKRRAAAAGLTPSGALCAAYAEVLATVATSSRFTLNVLTSRRHHVVRGDSEPVWGNFGSTIPLEVDFSRPEAFEKRARRLQHRLWDDLENAQFSAVHTARAAAQTRGLNTQAVLPVVFASSVEIDQGWAGQVPPGIREIASGLQTPQVYLDYQVYEYAGTLVGTWDFVPDLFPDKVIDEAFARHLQLLEDLASTGDPVGSKRRWRDGLLAEPPEAVVAALPAGSLTLDEHGLLHTAFFARAAADPDRPAVITQSETVSYGMLAAAADHVGYQLVESGVQVGDRVAIVMNKSWEQIAAVLGTLLAGAAYVPMDPGWPDARIDSLIGQAGATAVVTGPKAPRPLGTTVPVIHAATAELARTWAGKEPVGLLDAWTGRQPGPDGLAYVIYTSGSTGDPKGVAMNHRGPVNTIADINRRFGIGSTDRVLGLSSLSFDLSVYDIFGLLAVGGAVVLPAAADLRNPERWLELATRYQVSVWNSVPAFMNMFVDYLSSVLRPRATGLRLVMLSGDWIPVSLPGQIREYLAPADLVSLGGATEASIWSILYPIREVNPQWRSIPYGYSMEHQTVRVLNERLELAAESQIGEIYIGGVGLAREYLNRPDLTDERFVRHSRTGERLYRTGDLGRLSPSGTIEFLGRQDNQVKIQGHRVELGEIEAALRKISGIAAAVVAAVDGAGGGRSLAAWVISDSPDRLDPAQVNAMLRSQLPSYLIPRVINQIDSLPLTTNGKVDRQALVRSRPDPVPAQDAGADLPDDGVAGELSRILAKILELPDVGPDDDFFQQGGDSVAAIRVMSQVRKNFAVDLPIVSLFEAPTVRQLAAVIRRGTARPSPLALIRPGSGASPLFLVHPIGGTVLCYAKLAQRLGPEHPVYGLSAVGLQEFVLPQDDIEEMAASYLSTILQEYRGDQIRLAGWSMGGVIAYEMAVQLMSQQGEPAPVLLIDSECPSPLPEPLGEGEIEVRFARDRANIVHAEPGAVGHLEQGDSKRLYRVFRANSMALQNYQPARSNVQVVLYNAGRLADPTQGWGRVAKVARWHELAADHRTILLPTAIDELARLMQQQLGGGQD
jgi:amino acid adenylation domain-containing protein